MVILEAGATFLSIVVSASLKADPANFQQHSELTADVIKLLHGHAWFILPALGTLGIAKMMKAWIGPPWVWETIHRLLDSFQKHIFEKQSHEPQYFHRVTLFKYKGFVFIWRKWPSSGWLVPVERSGHITQRSTSKFKVPDNGSVEGIAGQVWVRNSVLTISLPDISSDSTAEEIASYAQRGFVSIEWVQSRLREKKTLPRSICGVPVEVNGKPWGVIVVDSRREKLPEKEIEKAHRLIAKVLGRLLEKRI